MNYQEESYLAALKEQERYELIGIGTDIRQDTDGTYYLIRTSSLTETEMEEAWGET